jgi:hypothetical protein
LAGCDRIPYELAPVHGTITVDDKPMFQGRIRFAPVAAVEGENPGKAAFGSIEKDGSYRLTTYEPKDGAVVGEHWVLVVNIEEELPDGVPEFARVTFPERVKVVGGQDNKIDINFSREVIKKYREDDT